MDDPMRPGRLARPPKQPPREHAIGDRVKFGGRRTSPIMTVKSVGKSASLPLVEVVTVEWDDENGHHETAIPAASLIGEHDSVPEDDEPKRDHAAEARARRAAREDG